MRLGTGRVATGRIPTGSARLGTGFVAGAGGGSLNAQVKVHERPMTMQGLGGIGGGTKSSYGRVIQDESFFVGALRTKITELDAEVTKMRGTIAALERDQSTYQSYQKRVRPPPAPPPRCRRMVG